MQKEGNPEITNVTKLVHFITIISELYCLIESILHILFDNEQFINRILDKRHIYGY